MVSGKKTLKENACEATFRKAFTLEHRKTLVARLVSHWARRGRTLLEIGCGSGYFTQFLWESGFDATAAEHDAKALGAARSRLGARVDFHLAAFDHLPFEDNSFDYATVITALDSSDDARAIVAEAARVAARGIVVVFKNRFSLYRLACLGRDKDMALSFLAARKMAREICPHCRIATRGIMAGPPLTWRDNRLCELINGPAAPPFMGAYIGMRLDFGAPRNVTPLSLRIKQACMKQAKPAAILENQNGARPYGVAAIVD